MKKLEWNDNYSVGLERMDKEHIQLFDMVNELNLAMSKGKGKEIVIDIVDRLFNYTASHFANEERYMKMKRFEGMDAHIAEHKAFVDQVVEFRKQIESGNILSLSVKVSRVINNWLRNHINEMDKQYGVIA